MRAFFLKRPELKNYNIIGQQKKDFITKIFKVHINSVYNWINKQYDVKKLRKEYENIKIIDTIECFILNSLNELPNGLTKVRQVNLLLF